MSKYNVADMKGNPIPDEVIEDWEKWANERPVSWEHLRTYLAKTKDETGFAMPRSLRPNVMVAGVPDKVDDEEITQPGNTDPHARMIDLICDMALVGNPDVQPPEVLGDFMQRARDILSVFDAEEIKKKWAGQEVPTTKWDYADEDGDVHSPAWYIEAFMVANMEYMRLHQNTPRDDDPVAMDNHMAALDDALLEAEMYERYVNKLFGYSDE